MDGELDSRRAKSLRPGNGQLPTEPCTGQDQGAPGQSDLRHHRPKVPGGVLALDVPGGGGERRQHGPHRGITRHDTAEMSPVAGSRRIDSLRSTDGRTSIASPGLRTA